MKIACWQAASPTTDDCPDSMLARLSDQARRAGEQGAELLVTPELFATGYPLSGRHEDIEEIGRSFAGRVEEIAARTGVSIVYGWPETSGAALHNSADLVTPTGGTQASYRKTHLFRNEQAGFAPGEVPVVQAQVGGITVGLAICYDVEFPEVVRQHSLAGTELLAVPTALMRPWTFVAETLVPARAFESQLFIAYANWAGAHRGLRYAGLSRVADPCGRVRTAGSDDEELLVAEIRPATLTRARATTRYLHDRRPELYAR
ncbi:carbon-nitrogen hydrolase family protein [Streptomyces zagrosensis]|uniref:Putative amidohydrolase n=1 Tax=Streptomyces zagrosensis TaxID=1042984 RepID=A0A7W9QF96_9ACTN|nr:carbon-nitrogen hydrolase family protein [Streptomyces zagrosensis]MBB5939066.1 putative amidohydrolase [Streptomyces zagrosensis]